MIELKPCPFCGGEVEEHGGLCNYGKHIMTLDLKCKGCGTTFKFKAKWSSDPYNETHEAWNRRKNNFEVIDDTPNIAEVVEHHGEDAKPKRRTLGASNPPDDRRCSQRGDTNCFGSYEKLL